MPSSVADPRREAQRRRRRHAGPQPQASPRTEEDRDGPLPSSSSGMRPNPSGRDPAGRVVDAHGSGRPDRSRRRSRGRARRRRPRRSRRASADLGVEAGHRQRVRWRASPPSARAVRRRRRRRDRPARRASSGETRSGPVMRPRRSRDAPERPRPSPGSTSPTASGIERRLRERLENRPCQPPTIGSRAGAASAGPTTRSRPRRAAARGRGSASGPTKSRRKRGDRTAAQRAASRSKPRPRSLPPTEEPQRDAARLVGGSERELRPLAVVEEIGAAPEVGSGDELREHRLGTDPRHAVLVGVERLAALDAAHGRDPAEVIGLAVAALSHSISSRLPRPPLAARRREADADRAGRRERPQAAISAR